MAATLANTTKTIMDRMPLTGRIFSPDMRIVLHIGQAAGKIALPES
jgi:hypothetical protein